jgi:hypothetical protein
MLELGSRRLTYKSWQSHGNFVHTRKENWGRVGLVCTMACIEAGLFFGLVESLNNARTWQLFTPLAFLSLWLVGSTLVFAFPRSYRIPGIISITVSVLSFFVYMSCLSVVPRGAICAAFSSVVSQLNNLQPPEPKNACSK